MEKKFWRIIELLQWGEEYFKNKGIEQPRLNIEHLLGHVLNKKRVELYLSYGEIVENSKLQELKELIKRFINHEPLMYILGETEFYGCKIKVNTKVLIPRPETELMMDEVIRSYKKLQFPDKILDLGTGSGCICIVLASQFKEAHITTVDISREALETAKDNALLNNVKERIEFVNEDMICFLEKNTKFDLIVSNPPYISKEDYLRLEASVKNFEPKLALTDDNDGKKYLKSIIEKLKNNLNANGFAFLEFGEGMDEWILNLTLQNGFQAKIFKDYHNIPRFIKIFNYI